METYTLEPTASEKNQLYEIIQNKKRPDLKNSTVYDALMKKEERVLSTIDRLIEEDQRKEQDATSFLQIKASRIPLMMIKTWNDIIQELLTSSQITPQRLLRIFTYEHRPIYMGLTLVVVSLFLILVNSSEHGSATTTAIP